MVLTILHAGGKFEGKNYKTSGGLHGVGASAVNALSKHLIAVVKRDGSEYKMEFAQGKPITGLLKGKGTVRGTGTTITFTPDPTIFPKTVFNSENDQAKLEITSFLHRGVKVHYHDEQSGAKKYIPSRKWNVDYLDKVITERTASTIHEAPFTLHKDGDERIEIALKWTNRLTNMLEAMSTVFLHRAVEHTKMVFVLGWAKRYETLSRLTI